MNASMKTIPLVLLLASIAFAPCLTAGETFAAEADQKAPSPGIWLSKGGASDYCIVVSESASPSEKRASQELQAGFRTCTGATLPVVAKAPAAGTPMIVLGCGPVAESLGVKPAPKELGEQGYVMRTVSPHLVIAGTPAAGTMYGVYDLLEECLGIRWYAPGVTKTPSTKDLPLPTVNKVVQPAFAWRHVSYSWPGRDADFMARVRDNSGGGGPNNPHGVQYQFDGQAHSYFGFMSPDGYFDTHPEYFSEVGGKRIREETQLCLTHPDVLEIVTEKMLKRMAGMPGVRQHNFSQMDWYNYCQCEKCSAINEKYGTTGGTQFWFVNQLAERTSKVYPEKLIGTLAYMYTEEPPKNLVMHPNVAVWLCHMFPSCDSHPIATCSLNASYKRRAEAWSKTCDHLYVWHYIVNFAHYFNPFPNFRAMASDMRFYRDIRVEGIYLQGMGAGGGGGELSLLRPYYGMKLLWNPDQDPGALMRDFLQGYYGPAWEPIWNYMTMLHDKVKKEDIHMHLYTNPGQGYLPDEVIAKSQSLFDEAEAAVKDNAELLERVRVARMPITYARLFMRNGYKLENESLTFLGDRGSVADAQAFLNRMGAHGFKTIREWGGEPEQLLMWATALNTPMPYNSLSNEFLTVDIVPFLGGRVLRIIDKKTGKCVTSHNTIRNLFFPFTDGEETVLGGLLGMHSAGTLEMFTVVAKTENSVTVEAPAAGFTLRRTITLLPDKPVVRIKAEVVNSTDKPRETTVRSHLHFDLGHVDQTRVTFTSRDGKRVEKTMAPIIANLREGEKYHDQQAPKGSWTFSGDKGLTVIQRFDDAAIDYATLTSFPIDLNVLESEIWGRRTVVAPGKSLSLTHELEVRACTSP